MGRRFHSPVGTGVYFSLLHTLDRPISDAVSVTSATAVAVMRAIRRLCGVQTEIKWVNDLYLGSRKICGILAESVLCAGQKPRLILGVGVNLSTEDFPTELAGIAGSLGAKELSRADLIAAIVGELEPFLCDPTDRSWLPDYKAASMVLGNAVRWSEHGRSEEGVAVDVDDRGGLVVRTASGEEKTLASGEISLRLG
jgi:BirA family biotin operon repressor/biotin-[acetyl-CoA-carboxylase] ligase